MARKLFDSPYIFGIHEEGGEGHMLAAGKPGWILLTEGIGDDPNRGGGRDFRQWSDQGLGVMCRINNGYQPAGTIPHSSRYKQFARRCARFVADSQGCKIWLIGNEMNYWVERAGAHSRGITPVDDPLLRGLPDRFSALLDEPRRPTRSGGSRSAGGGEVITPELYARCYALCREAIHSAPGHEDDQVLIGSVAPWNADTTYPGNDNGDWVQYFRDILTELGPDGCDGISIHTYTHGASPDLIGSAEKLRSFPQYHYHFFAYRDFMKAVPANMRRLPVYLTETDQGVDPWVNNNNGWIKQAYKEIDRWNKTPGNQQIRALILYRWPKRDKWVIEGKQGVIEDFKQAMQNDYRWRETGVEAADFPLGSRIYAADEANIRSSEGYQGKPESDVIATAPAGTEFTLLSGPHSADSLPWWQIRCTLQGRSISGWVAQATPAGQALLSQSKPETAPVEPPQPEPEPVEPAPQPPQPVPAPAVPIQSDFWTGQQVITADEISLRRSPGWRGKTAGDVVAQVAAGRGAVVFDGPELADDLVWWRLRAITLGGQIVEGWAAQTSASGTALLLPLGGQPTSPSPDPVTPVEPTPVTPGPGSGAGVIEIGGKVTGADEINLRRSPGWRGKAASDIIYAVPAGTEYEVLDGPSEADGLLWWQVRFTSEHGNRFSGWAAQATNSGDILLQPAGGSAPVPSPVPPPQPEPEPIPAATLQIGSQASTRDSINMRRSPGWRNKPANDILYDVPAGSQIEIVDGPQNADDLIWWRCRYVSPYGNTFSGWGAQFSGSGRVLLEPAGAETPTPPPEPPAPPPSSGKFPLGSQVYAAAFINVRKTAGYAGKPGSDVLAEAPYGASMTILAGPSEADGLSWWRVRYIVRGGEAVDGWLAETDTQGKELLSRSEPPPPQPDGPVASKQFRIGDMVFNAYNDTVNLRRSPGYRNKGAGDVVIAMPGDATPTIVAGPKQADDLRWWQVRGALAGEVVEGWMAEVGVMGERFLVPAQFRGRLSLGKPFAGSYRVTQLFGDNRDYYSQYSYDGVALRGHNGIDFGIPTGTQIQATDDGEVVDVDFEAGGLGNYVKLKHEWGESLYAHMKRVDVQAGDVVKRGDSLGPSDNTGGSTGPHLHFGIRIHPYIRGDGWGGCCDPIPLMDPADVNIPDSIRGPARPPSAMAADAPGRVRP